MNSECKELFNKRRAAFKEHVATHHGVMGREAEKVCNLGRSGANLLIRRMLALGDIFRSGAGANTRYWLNEEHYRENGMEDQQREAMRIARSQRVIKRRGKCEIRYLNENRPSGINTIFEECKENSKLLLPLLRVMAARRSA